ncbi:MAG: hypothetical protein IKL68_04030 [Clostridia bacterium]|nr:hypothetical protein [Clostridia bacterium]
MSRKDKREENRKHESKPKKKIVIKLPEFQGFTKKQIMYAIGIAVLLISILCVTNYANIGLVLNKRITDEDVTIVDLLSSNNKIYSYYNEALVADSSGISTYNKYGRKTWNIDMQGAIDSKICTSGKYLQVINTDKSIVYVYKDKYEVAQIRIKGKILYGTINSKGDSVIEHTDAGNKTVLAIYDKNGKLKYNIKLSNNAIAQYVLSEDSTKFAYVEVNISGISATSTVQVVELKGADKESKVEQIALEENTLIYEIDFYGNNLVYRTDKDIVSINLNNKNQKRSSLEQEGIVSLDLNKNKYSYVEFEKGKYFLGIKSIGGKDTKEIEVKESPKYYIYTKDKAYVCFQKEMQIYNNFKMKIKEYKSEMVITKPIVFGEGNGVAFLVSNKLIIYTI